MKVTLATVGQPAHIVKREVDTFHPGQNPPPVGVGESSVPVVPYLKGIAGPPSA